MLFFFFGVCLHLLTASLALIWRNQAVIGCLGDAQRCTWNLIASVVFYKLAPLSLSGIEFGVLALETRASPLKAAELLIDRIKVHLGIWVFRTEKGLK